MIEQERLYFSEIAQLLLTPTESGEQLKLSQVNKLLYTSLLRANRSGLEVPRDPGFQDYYLTSKAIAQILDHQTKYDWSSVLKGTNYNRLRQALRNRREVEVRVPAGTEINLQDVYNRLVSIITESTSDEQRAKQQAANVLQQLIESDWASSATPMIKEYKPLSKGKRFDQWVGKFSTVALIRILYSQSLGLKDFSDENLPKLQHAVTLILSGTTNS